MSVYEALAYRHSGRLVDVEVSYYCLRKLIEWLPALSLRPRKSGIHGGAGIASSIKVYTNFCQVHVRTEDFREVIENFSTQTSVPLDHFVSLHEFSRCEDLLEKESLPRRYIRHHTASCNRFPFGFQKGSV